MNPRNRSVAAASLLAILVALAAACAGPAPTTAPSASPSGLPSVLPSIVSSELAVGPNRVVFAFLDARTNTPAGAPDRSASVEFVGPAGQAVPSSTGTFVWAIENVAGVYATHATFPVAGDWTAIFTTAAPGSPEETASFGFQVKDKTQVIAPGQPAPSVETPTLESVGGDVAKISTDASPVPAFYSTSVAAALAAHKPFLLAFATPKFCQTQTCGPTLDKLKPIAAAHPEITFINVEPYQLAQADGQLQPVLGTTGQLQTVPATDAYGLLSEPYIFVVGGDGLVKATFELIFTPEEIDAALAGLT